MDKTQWSIMSLMMVNWSDELMSGAACCFPLQLSNTAVPCFTSAWLLKLRLLCWLQQQCQVTVQGSRQYLESSVIVW